MNTSHDVTVRWFSSILDKRSRRAIPDYAGRNVMDYLPAELPNDRQLRVVLNGELLDPEGYSRIAAPGDEILFYQAPGAIGTILIGLLISVVLTGISYAVSALTAPPVPALDSDLDTSPTYGFDGLYNTVRPGTPIPIVYGTHRVAGHLIDQFQREARVNTSGGTHPKSSEMHTLIGICSGPIESISSVRVNGNPITDYGEDVQVEYRLGGSHQAPVDGFRDVVTEYQKDADLTYTGGSQTFTTGYEVDAIEVAVRFPGGLYEVSDRGQYLWAVVGFKLDWRAVDDAGDPVTEYWSAPETFKVPGRTQNAFDAWWESPRLRRARYQIRIQRTTPDQTEATSFSSSRVRAVNDVVEETLTYPRTALLAVRQLPTAQISGQPPVYDSLVEGKIVRIYTDSTTYTEAWSDNPAWCLLDFMTADFDGQGPWLSTDQVDIDAFIDWADFCDEIVPIDERGGTEKRARLNIVLDGATTVIDAIKQIAATGLANVFLRGDKWSVKPEKAETPVQFFQMSRILKDSFSAAKRARAEVANYFVGEFWNEDDNYEQDTLPREDPSLLEGSDQIEKTINLMGSTKVSQVNRILNQIMLDNRLSRRTLAFDAGVEALACEAGDVVKIAHDVPGWGYSGNIRAVMDGAGTDIVLDREVTIEAGKTYELTVIHATDEIDVVSVTSNPATTRRIQVSGDWSQTLVAGVDYAFGEVSRSTVLYRITSITIGADITRRKIQAKEYDADVYGTNLAVLPAPSPSRLPNPNRIPDNPTNLRLAEREVYAEDGTLSVAIDVHFTLPIVADARAAIYWREAGGALWEPVGEPVGFGYASITRDVESPGRTYEVSVVGVSANGNRRHADLGAQATITTTGTTRQPENVVGFTADRTLEGLVFTWAALDPVKNFDLSGYEIRDGTSWDTATVIGQTTDIKLETRAFVKGSRTFLLKGFNSAGRYSPTAAAVVMLVDERIGENVVYTRQEETAWAGTKEGFTVDSDDLLLDTEDSAVAWRALPHGGPGRSALIPGGFGTGYRVSGTYTTDIFEVSATAIRCLIATDFEADQIDTTLTWGSATVSPQTWGSDFARSRAWGVAPDGRVTVRVEMRFSSTTSDEGAFGPWQVRPQNIETLVAYAQARIVVLVQDPAYTVRVSKLQIIFDVPDVIESDTVATEAGGTVAVVFAKSFNIEPKLTATVIGATAGDEIFITSKSATGFSIEVQNATSRVVRNVNWTAVGY